jgi:urease accessory protein
MQAMHIVRQKLETRQPELIPVKIHAERATLLKTRWRGAASDGTEFGFDLHEPLRHGDAIHATGECVYVIDQQPEPVLEVNISMTPAQATLLAWSIGNLHQPMEIACGCVRVPDESSLRSLLANLGMPYKQTEAVFQPQGGPVRPHQHHHTEHAHHH